MKDMEYIPSCNSSGWSGPVIKTGERRSLWALRGGGASAYGVVTSAITEAHPKIPASTATQSFSYPADVSENVFKSPFALG